MQKKAFVGVLFGVSVAAVAATGVGPVAKKSPPPVRAASVVPAVASVAQSAPAVPSGAIASSIARWNSLRQSDNHPFSAYASFLASHRGWPGESAMRRAAERQAGADSASPSEVAAFFRTFPPLTAAGHARNAFALQALGRADEARTAARTAWTSGAMPAADEQRLLGAFGSTFGPADHDARLDALLGNGDTQSAQRSLAWASAQRRPLYEARLALQTRAADARSRVDALGTAHNGDAGLLIDKANFLRNSGDPLGARQLLARPRTLTAPPANAEKFMEAAFALARGAANDRQWSLAYDIASKVDDLFPQGTDISRRSFGERDQYTNLTWLAGTTALQRLGRPVEAVGMFERYGRASQSPQSQTKGIYWAGRAASAAGQAQRSQELLREAARHYDQFYGQLAAERLGIPLPAPATGDPAQPSAAERAAFAQRPLVAAVRYLGATGNWRDQSVFVRALAEHVESDSERLMAVQLGQEIGRIDLGVLVARRARTNGSFDYKRWGFPEVRVPAAQAQNWTIVHAITRQESLFDREAVSSAGARGLMQLMPGTARETATRLSLPYDQARLTRDPEYNVMLGSAYFARLLDQYRGSYPLAVAAYNAGPGNVNRWLRENGDPRTSGVDMVEWIEQIGFFETRNYVQRVLENAVVYDLLHPSRARSSENRRIGFYLGQ